MSKWITESALVAVMNVLNDPLHWMIIEDENKKWNFKSRKVEVGKSKNIIIKKMFDKIISVQTDHWVNISSSSMHVLNDPLHWMIIEDENQKWNLKFPKSKVEVGKSKKI